MKLTLFAFVMITFSVLTELTFAGRHDPWWRWWGAWWGPGIHAHNCCGTCSQFDVVPPTPAPSISALPIRVLSIPSQATWQNRYIGWPDELGDANFELPANSPDTLPAVTK